jgi:AAA domain
MTKPRTKAPIVPTGTVLAEPPAPVPLIEDTVPADAVVLLVGTPGSGRSTLLAELAAAVAHGELWQGHATRPGKVLYLDLSREPRDIAYTIDSAAGQETPTDWLRVLSVRIGLRGGIERHLADLIAANGYGLILVDALADIDRESIGLDHPVYADRVAALATLLFNATAAGGSVVLAGECDVRGVIVGAPLGDGVDVTLRLTRGGGRTFVRPVGPARSGRRRPPPPAPPRPDQTVFEVYGDSGSWGPDGQWVSTPGDPNMRVSR